MEARTSAKIIRTLEVAQKRFQLVIFLLRKLQNTSRILIRKRNNFFLLLILLFYDSAKCNPTKKPNPLILISIDGFRYDYIKLYKPPTLMRLKKNGLNAESLVPIYPSKTFPNHFSIITGLRADKHGIISNSFIIKNKPEVIFKINNKNIVNRGYWYLGEPLWNTVMKNGLKTASYYWVGSESIIKGMRPNYYKSYNNRTPGEQRVDQIIQWLTLPEEDRPSFITLYFSKVDSRGHKFGPVSKKVKDAVFDIDDHIDRLIRKLNKNNINANILIVSDHGMREIDNDGFVSLPKSIRENQNIKIVGGGSLSLLYINDIKTLKKANTTLKKNQNWDTFLYSEIPKRYYLKNKDRVPDILLVSKPGKYILKKGQKHRGKGTHGYDPKDKLMHGILLGIGPNIRNVSIKSIENIHLFPFMAKLLNLPNVPKVDGKLSYLNEAYKESLNKIGR